VKFSDTPGSIRSLAPQLGQHTDEILGALGYGKDEIDRWREAGAIK
jgi:formyl-CoA transferase